MAKKSETVMVKRITTLPNGKEHIEEMILERRSYELYKKFGKNNKGEDIFFEPNTRIELIPEKEVEKEVEKKVEEGKKK